MDLSVIKTFGFISKKYFVFYEINNFVSYTVLGTFIIYPHAAFYSLT